MSVHRKAAALLLLVAGVLFGCAGGVGPADLVVTGGRIVTVDDQTPEAEALAIVDGRIAAVGSAAEIERWIGNSTEVVELDGRLALPGFIEGHGHLLNLGRALENVRLEDAGTWDEVVGRVAAAAADLPAGTWIRGRGWHQEKWSVVPNPTVDGFPVHDLLSEAVPDHPVILTHASGHGSIVNARAMTLVGIDRATPDPAGGRIQRDTAGRATGVLIETAQGLVGRAYADIVASRTEGEQRASARRALDLAIRESLAHGVTSFQDAGSPFEVIDLLREMVDAGELDLRMWVMLSESNDALEQRIESYRMVDYGDGRLTVRAIKRAIDGALGSHGAWLLEPYADLPGSPGLNTQPIEMIEETARIAAEHGFQLCVHAIGDRGNREMLDLFERTFAANPDLADPRWRIEHAQHLHPDDIPRFAELGVIASMQGVHCTSDAPWVPKRLGDERSRDGAYVWRALLDSGAVVSNGTDVPVESIDPIANFHSTVTRETGDGARFYPEQAMTRLEALRSLTLSAAYAAFEEGSKGSLAPGKLGDLVVLSKDILRVPENEILDARVDLTIVGGSVVFRR